MRTKNQKMVAELYKGKIETENEQAQRVDRPILNALWCMFLKDQPQ